MKNIQVNKNRIKEYLTNKTVISTILIILVAVKIPFLVLYFNNYVTWWFVDVVANINYYDTIVFLIPAIEEIFKIFPSITNKLKLFRRFMNVERWHFLIIGYIFQVVEAAYYYSWGDESYWLRFFLPMHVFFTFIATYSLGVAIGFHMLWNFTAVYFTNETQLILIVIYYIIFAAIIYFQYFKDKTEINNISKTNNILL